MSYGPPYQDSRTGHPPYGAAPPPNPGFPPVAFGFPLPVPTASIHQSQYQNQNHLAHQAQYVAPQPIYPQQPQLHYSYPPPIQQLAVFPQHQKQPYNHSISPSLPVPIAPQAPQSYSTISAPQISYASIPPSEPAVHQPPAIDYHQLLLALAEEYLDAAQKERGTIRKGQEQDRYYKCIATGLACLETVLSTWRLPPRAEAAVRLRYASVLYEETENTGEAESSLIKGITLCERNRLVDLRYTMQHLLVRITFQKNPKATLKTLDDIIRDAEAYQHILWLYAFRFLRTSLSLESGALNENNTALHNLRSISGLASSRGDQAVYVLSSIVEALVHLRLDGPDSIEQAQRAIASARSLQLEHLMGDCPQLVALLYILDLACSLKYSHTSQAMPKMQALRAVLDNHAAPEGVQRKPSPPDGVFSIPILRSPHSGPPLDASTTGGILSSNLTTDYDFLYFSWMPARELYILGYYLDAVTTSHRNSQDGHRAEKSLEEGLKMLRDTASNPTLPQWLKFRKLIQCHFRIQLIFLRCARSEWTSASKLHDRLTKDLPSLALSPTHPVPLLTTYLSAVLAQGTGNLPLALALYSSPTFSLAQFPAQSSSGSHTASNVHLDLSLLSTLSQILILRSPTTTQSSSSTSTSTSTSTTSTPNSNHHPSLAPLFTSLEPLAPNHPNPHLTSLYHLTLATSHPTDPGIIRKNHLQAALTAAKIVSNTQLTAITLNFMSWKYFRGVVGEQAEKSARAGWRVSLSGGDRLWIAVAGGMLGETLDRVGKHDEAQCRTAEAVALAAEVRGGLMAGETQSSGVT